MSLRVIGDEVHEGDWVDCRWQCPRGHFLAEANVNSETFVDPGAYYGVSSTIWADCSVCGVVESPRLVEIGRHPISARALPPG